MTPTEVEPAGQAAQSEVPESWYSFTGHTQSPTVVLPMGDKRPAAQAVQVSSPAFKNVPTLHLQSLSKVDPSNAIDDAGQTWHAAVPYSFTGHLQLDSE
jgi:hypothetical protein